MEGILQRWEEVSMVNGTALVLCLLTLLSWSSISVAEEVTLRDYGTFTVLKSEGMPEYRKPLSIGEINKIVQKHVQLSSHGIRGRVVFSRDKKTNAKTFYVNIEDLCTRRCLD